MWFSLFFSVNNITKPMYYCLYIHENFQLFWNLFHFSSSPLGLGSLSSQIPSLGALVPPGIGFIRTSEKPRCRTQKQETLGTSPGWHWACSWQQFLWGSTSQWKPASSVVPAPTGWLPFDSPIPQILSGLPPNTPSFPNLARNYLTTWQDVCLSVWTLGRWCCPEASPWSLESRHCI